jgi:hypothetical protein
MQPNSIQLEIRRNIEKTIKDMREKLDDHEPYLLNQGDYVTIREDRLTKTQRKNLPEHLMFQDEIAVSEVEYIDKGVFHIHLYEIDDAFFTRDQLKFERRADMFSLIDVLSEVDYNEGEEWEE